MDGNPSWLLNQRTPSNQFTAPTQSTTFGTSSLASASTNYLTYDGGSQDFQLRKTTNGNPHKNNLNIIDQDKSNLGLQNVMLERGLTFAKKDPRALTVPYVYTENRSSLLRTDN